MKILKMLTVVMVISGIVLLSLSCNSGSASATPTSQLVTVKRGNISVSITGTGSLALENKQALSFGQTGVASQATTAKISEVDVVAGQTVKKGQVLVKADTADYQNQLVTDQHNLDSTTAGVTQSQANLAAAQQTLIQDQQSLVKAQQTLNAQQDVQNLQTQIDNANIQLQQAKTMLEYAQKSATGDVKAWNEQINYLSVDTKAGSTNPKRTPDGGQISVLQKQMKALLDDPIHAGAVLVTSGADGAAQIQADTLAVQVAQAKITTDQANITNAQNNVTVAQNKVADAQTTLTTDKNSAQEIAAPFDGLITQVNVTQGSIVQRNATLIEIAVPDKFIANISVTERDVLSVKVGDDAIVSLNAMAGYNFPSKVTQVAPVATVSQGVVNYQITVELTSTTPQTARTARPSAVPSATSAPVATGTARPRPSLSASPSATAAPEPSASPSATTGISLKDGLSAVVTIPVQTRTNVLLVSSRAITRTGQEYTVQKVTGSVVETVTVQIGITDGTNTEITTGLNEGDQVMLKSTTAATNTQGGLGGGGLRLP